MTPSTVQGKARLLWSFCGGEGDLGGLPMVVLTKLRDEESAGGS